MENFKFVTDRQPLTPDDVKAHKDFDKVLNQYKNLPVKFYKSGWFKAGLASVTVVATGTFLFFATGDDNNNKPEKKVATVTGQTPYADETPCVKSPAPQIDLNRTSFTINPSRDTILHYETGSALVYKAGSLVDENGNSVSGQVVIQYREFHNPIEVFASGIPMRYDSAGTQYQFKSAGMVEILAFQNNKPLTLSSGKEIEIQMNSGISDGSFNLYYLDTAKRQWNYEGKDKILAKQNEVKKTAVPSKKIVLTKSDTVKIMHANNIKAPVKPRKLNTTAFNFTLDVLPDEFPELDLYQSTRFQVIDNTNSFTAQMYTTEWEDALLKEVLPGEKYELTLTRGTIVKKITVVPVLDGADYKKAQDEYAKKYKVYQSTLNAKVKEEKLKREKEIADQSKWEKEAYQKYKEKHDNLTASVDGNAMNRFAQDMTPKGIITRTFSASRFGIWNCDSPKELPKGENVMAKFVNQDGEQLPLTEVWLCEKNNKMVFSYTFPEFKNFKFNPKQQNIVWGLTSAGTLAYALETDFQSAVNSGKSKIFKMNIYAGEIKNTKQIKDLFEL